MFAYVGNFLGNGSDDSDGSGSPAIQSVKYILILKPEGGGPAPEVRLRRLLKAALRCFGLRCCDYRIASDTEASQINKNSSVFQSRAGPDTAGDEVEIF